MMIFEELIEAFGTGYDLVSIYAIMPITDTYIFTRRIEETYLILVHCEQREHMDFT